MNRHFLFIGNSLTREMLLGIACNAHALGLVDRIELKYFPVGGELQKGQYNEKELADESDVFKREGDIDCDCIPVSRIYYSNI